MPMRKLVLTIQNWGWQVSFVFRSCKKLTFSSPEIAVEGVHVTCVPPGAVGGTYGSGCFQPFSSFSVSESKAYGLFVVWDRLHGDLPQITIGCTALDLSIIAVEQPSPKQGAAIGDTRTYHKETRLSDINQLRGI
ncbi:hypothetical protein IF1G_02407 [Cordyceps javanica]|uniref:Uncharacterized protein n=1 Tax=Cordyceps javanica TaxID=43265 RepID=A0A545V9C8_9HYPO|nr:hypothetical protein IF1G_02407 [Cordyceps javanica]